MSRTPVSAIAQYAPCTIFVKGQVAYSRIASQVDGAELAKINQEAAAKGRLPHSKPYTSITIKNPVILDNGSLPPQVKQVIQERFYPSKDGSMLFSQESKSPFLPAVVYSIEAGELKGQGIADRDVPLQAELASGLSVTVAVSLFSKNGFAGLGMSYILVNEPIRYYTNSAIAAAFADMGIEYTAPVKNANQQQAIQQQTAQFVPQQPVQNTQPVQYQQPVQQAQPTQYQQPQFNTQQSNPYEDDDDLPFTFNPPAQPTQPVQYQQPQVQAQPNAFSNMAAQEPAVQRPVRYY